jgi:urease accessory protein
MPLLRSFCLSSLLALVATPALAHSGAGDAHGFIHGFAHPIGGFDHILAMVTVGLLASMLGGRALWLVPLSFVGMMIVGGALGMTGVGLPFVELGILGSVIVLGATVALGRPWSLGLAMALVGVFAVFHGHAHGAEMPAGAGALFYASGFAIATALLHAVGIGTGLILGRWPALSRLAGAGVALAGVALMAG